ncbi:MAG: hypothetical protein WCR52_07080 [Bacteroidota bacterium]
MKPFGRHAVLVCIRVILLLVFCAGTSFGQDLEAVYQNLKGGGNRHLQVGGGLNISNTSYYSRGIAARQDALQWLIGANLNLRFMGITAPFALYFSDGNRAFRLPSYTFTGISPSYKWATLHLGDRNMNFSRYTLSGILFRGIGFELKPGRWYAGAMYGRLTRATNEDLNALQRIDPVYRRIGYGVRVGYMGNRSTIGLSWFGVQDDKGSIPTPQLSTILPTQNGVMSLQGSQRIGRKLNLEAEYARSATNTNSYATTLTNADKNAGNTLIGTFKPNESIQTGNAFRAGAQYNFKAASVNGNYERIDQGFRTLGALFFLSDVERITAGFNKAFLNNTLFVSANGGTERTDLDGKERNGVKRLIGSLNTSYSPTERLSFNGTYSNFQNTAKLRTVNDASRLVDSLILAQVTQSMGVGASYIAGNKKEPGVWSINLTRQQAKSVVNDAVQNDANSVFFIASLFYSKSRPEELWSWSAGMSWNKTQLATTNSNMLSPTVGVNRSFFNKSLETSARFSYNSIFVKNGADNSALNVGLGGNLHLKHGHSFGLDSSLINRMGGGNDFLEFYTRLYYAYAFNKDLGKKAPVSAPK